MDNLLWILPRLICPLGMLLMGVAAKLGLRSSEPSAESAGKRQQDAHPAPRPQAS